MQKKKKPQYVTLVQEYPYRLHCPICGHCMMKLKDHDEAQGIFIAPCPHLLFVWHEECFGYLSDRFVATCEKAKSKVRKLAEKSDWLDELAAAEEYDLDGYVSSVLLDADMEFRDFLALAGYDSTLVCIDLVEEEDGQSCLLASFGFDCPRC